jgi:hypothetical protein
MFDLHRETGGRTLEDKRRDTMKNLTFNKIML